MRAAVLLLACVLAAPGHAAVRDTSAGPVEITAMVTELEQPWAFAFLPGDALLITERNGRLWHVAADGTRNAVAGVPDVAAVGQGGLLDVVAARDFDRSRNVFLTFAKPQGSGEGTAVARARLSPDGSALQDLQVIWELGPETSGGTHFGARIVEGPEGYLYVTVGDRGQRQRAQDLSLANGAVIRIAPDGAIPADNPFAGQPDVDPAIWSYGHRNPQGAARDGAGRIWVVEHGARGGDEVNLLARGANYGWPVISYGTHYSGAKIGEGTAKPGLEQPAHYWDPSIAPSGMTIYEGTLFPQWQGDILVGSLKFGLVSRLERGAGRLSEVERIDTPETERVRDIRTAPDGAIWFLSVGNGALYRMAPAP